MGRTRSIGVIRVNFRPDRRLATEIRRIIFGKETRQAQPAETKPCRFHEVAAVKQPTTYR